jgi:hypothetical protein
MKMRSAQRGKSTWAAEVTNVSANGLWMLIDGEELFLAFDHFPWFREATIGRILKVERPARHHLYWPNLDVDLEVDSIRHPDKYPLVSRVGLEPHAVKEPVARGAAVKKRKRPAKRS